MSSTINEVSRSVAPLESALLFGVNQAIAHRSEIMQGAQYIYQLLTEEKRKPFSNSPKDGPRYIDKSRYDRLCYLRMNGELTQNECHKFFPETKKWTLDDNGCPQHIFNFHDAMENMREDSKRLLRTSSCPQNLLIASLLTEISNVFEELSHRSWTNMERLNKTFNSGKVFREDGFEAMFFSDLADWLSIYLPNLPAKQLETSRLIFKWIQYCEKVQQTVLVRRHSKKDAITPRWQLDTIIMRLKKLHENYEKMSQASTFNDQITAIDRSFIQISHSVFNIFFFLINKSTKGCLSIDKLLSQQDPATIKPRDPTMMQITNTLMGKWICSTLNQLGITSDDLEPTKEIDLDSTYDHLETDFSKLKDFSNTGLWEFAQRPRYTIEIGYPFITLSPFVLYCKIDYDNQTIIYRVKSPLNENVSGEIPLSTLDLHITMSLSTAELQRLLNTKLENILSITSLKRHTYKPTSNAIDYLIKIIQIHRALEQMMSTRENIILSSKVNDGWGSVWIFGADTGLPILNQLLKAIDETSKKLLECVEIFWDSFYKEDFRDYHDNDPHSSCSEQLHEIQGSIDEIKRLQKNINTQIKDIRAAASEPDRHQKLTLDFVKKLQDNLNKRHVVIEKRENILPPSPLAVIHELEQFTIQQEPIIEPQSIKMSKIQINSKEAYLFIATLDRLNTKSLNERQQTLTMLCKPSSFHSRFQEAIYNIFLAPKYSATQSPWFFACFFGLSKDNIASFIELYQRINMIMTMIYTSKRPNGELLTDLTALEISLLDHLLYATMYKSFQDHKFYDDPLRDLPKPNVLILDEETKFFIYSSLQLEGSKEMFTNFDYLRVMANESDAKTAKALEEIAALKEEMKAVEAASASARAETALAIVTITAAEAETASLKEAVKASQAQVLEEAARSAELQAKLDEMTALLEQVRNKDSHLQETSSIVSSESDPHPVLNEQQASRSASLKPANSSIMHSIFGSSGVNTSQQKTSSLKLSSIFGK